MKWRILPIPTDDTQAYKDAVRLNALGSLFFFANYVLKKTRLAKLHYQMCQSLEREDLHLVLEEPMGMFKTTVGIALSMWWALPFTLRDEYMMRKLGYDDSWIRWMKLAHNPNTRTLYTHEIESRAVAMGKEVDEHYQSNDTFRFVFDEIIPDASCSWNDHTKFQKRMKGSNIDATTGTFEYRGVGQALQGVHPDRTIQDDNMGKAAQYSMLKGDGRILEDLIRWHRQLTTRLDTVISENSAVGSQLVIGNRWGHNDLNSWIRENQPHFKFETHSAEGGCCKLHPFGQSIFPEEWSMARLQQKRADVGPYDYAHFYLNQSVLPEECIFKPEWLRYFKFKPSRPDLPLDSPMNLLMLEHEVRDGETLEDVVAGDIALQFRIIVDLAHAKKQKRCNHVILIAGYDASKGRAYLLDVWAKACNYADLVDKIYERAKHWKIREIYLETVAAQNLLKFHMEERNKREPWPLWINELDYDNSENAKVNRIEGLVPAFKNGQIWCHRSQSEFLGEYNSYPAGLRDVLDTLGYLFTTFNTINAASAQEFLLRQQEQFRSRVTSGGGY